jgi:molybdate transport system substrate-binding protein
MLKMKSWKLTIGAVTLLILSAYSTHAQEEIMFVAPNILREPIQKIIPAFEAKTGHKVIATFGAEAKTREQILHDNPFDVSVVEAPDADAIASGNVVASSETPFANVSIGVAVRKGAPKPDISTPEAVKRALLAASSISYPDPSNGAAAGVAVDAALKKLGIADEEKSKTRLSQGGARAMAMVANGEAEIGLTFINAMTDPGVEVVGRLPREVSPPTVFVGFVSSNAKDPATAKEFLKFLSSSEAATAFKADRMEPDR